MKSCRATTVRNLAAASAAGFSVATMVLLADLFRVPLVLLPFTVSIVVVVTMPASPIARLRAVAGSHAICALTGIATNALVTNLPLSLGLAVGAAVLGMMLTDTMHPPACVSTFIVITQHASWLYLLAPVALGLTILVSATIAIRFSLRIYRASAGRETHVQES